MTLLLLFTFADHIIVYYATETTGIIVTKSITLIKLEVHEKPLSVILYRHETFCDNSVLKRILASEMK